MSLRSYVGLGCVLAVVAGAGVAARAEPPANNLIANPEFVAGPDGSVKGWTFWAPRTEIASGKSADGKTLSLSCDRFEQYGAWLSDVSSVDGGRYYRFEIRHRASGVKSESADVGVILTWHKAGQPKSELQRDYVDPVSGDSDGWRLDARTLKAPDGAGSVSVELFLRWTPHGSVEFKSPSLAEVPAPAKRVARIITTHLDPARPASIEGNTRLMGDMLDSLVGEHPDLVLFSENFVDRGVKLPFDQKSQPVPGPLTTMLSQKARALHSYVVTTLHEMDQGVVYNTAVLIDRDGNLAGKYHKVHLTIAEGDGGITPGTEYPVFQTDFGKIGILTCWDNWFLEPARILRLKGAEIILFPLAGDGVPLHYEAVTRTRAMDNGVYLVGRANGPFAHAVADLDLNQEWRVRYLSVAGGDGEGKSLYIKERRPDTYSELTGGGKP